MSRLTSAAAGGLFVRGFLRSVPAGPIKDSHTCVSVAGTKLLSLRDALVAIDAEFLERRNLVVQLEKMHDEFGLAGDLPTGDELAADFQDFLRETNPDEPT